MPRVTKTAEAAAQQTSSNRAGRAPRSIAEELTAGHPTGADGAHRDLIDVFERGARDGSTTDAIHAALAEGIETGTLPEGARLGEEYLAGLFRVSRTPIREALMRLEAEHLVERYGRSLVVGRISVEQIIEVYVVREALDGAAALLAATHGQELDFVELERINDQLRGLAEAGEHLRMAELNLQFHNVLARASRNEMLRRFVGQVHSVVRRFRTTTFSHPGRAIEAVEEHARILEALRARNGELAEERARMHMHKAREVRIALEIDARTATPRS